MPINELTDERIARVWDANRAALRSSYFLPWREFNVCERMDLASFAQGIWNLRGAEERWVAVKNRYGVELRLSYKAGIWRAETGARQHWEGESVERRGLGELLCVCDLVPTDVQLRQLLALAP